MTQAGGKLLEAGADPNAQDRRDATVSHVAALWGSSEMVAVLPCAGADLKYRCDPKVPHTQVKGGVLEFIVRKDAR